MNIKFILKYFIAYYITKSLLYYAMPNFHIPFKTIIIAILAYLLTYYILENHNSHKQHSKPNNKKNVENKKYSGEFTNKDLSNVKKARQKNK